MAGDSRLKISREISVSLVTLSAIQIVLAVGAIGVAIPMIVFAMQSYYECYLEAVYGPGMYDSKCNLYYYLNRFALTAQGIWTGAFVIISAALTIDFAKRPLTKTGSLSIGFTTLSLCLCIAMIVLEAFGVSDYDFMTHNYNDDLIWSLHCVNLAIASVTLPLLLASLTIVSTQRCCSKKKKQVYNENMPVTQYQIPMAMQAPTAQPIGVPYVIAAQQPQQFTAAQPYPSSVLTPPPPTVQFIAPPPVGQSAPENDYSTIRKNKAEDKKESLVVENEAISAF